MLTQVHGVTALWVPGTRSTRSPPTSTGPSSTAAQPRNNMTSGFYRRVYRKNDINKNIFEVLNTFDLKSNIYVIYFLAFFTRNKYSVRITR
jgi:hypothetical protein